MSKPLNVAIYSVLLITLYFGSAVLVQSCGSKDKTEEVQSGNDKLEDIVDGVSESSWFEEDDDVSYSSDNDDTSSEANDTEEVQATEEIDYTAPPVETKPVQTNTNTSTSTVRTTGKYAIVAGNYLVESNADAMVKKLNKMGYSAEKVVFDLSQYYTVVAGRYNSRSSANSKSASLKSSGYDNYVITSK